MMDQSTAGPSAQLEDGQTVQILSGRQGNRRAGRRRNNTRGLSRGPSGNYGPRLSQHSGLPSKSNVTIDETQQSNQQLDALGSDPSSQAKENSYRSSSTHHPFSSNHLNRGRGRNNRYSNRGKSYFRQSNLDSLAYGRRTEGRLANESLNVDNNLNPNATNGSYSNESGAPIIEDYNIDQENQKIAAPRRFIRDRNVCQPSRSDPTEIVQSQISENQFKSNTFECMICCDNIHLNNPIWYCTSCYNIFHMKCAIEWCNKSIKSRDEAIASAQFPSLGDSTDNNVGARSVAGRAATSSSRLSNYRDERQKSVEWPCPTCRKVLHSRPGKYKCFCAKVVRPEVNRHLTPHSCGQLCGRKRPDSDCPHSCNAICHPGRCQPCTLTSKKTCYCGKSTNEVKCSSQVSSCGEVCGKELACGRHSCSKLCHDGRCSPCKEIFFLKCYCGSEEIAKNCEDHIRSMTGAKPSADRFSCVRICDKLLDCGKHRCLERCHPSPKCSSCPLLSQNLKTCPCGSKSLSKSMLEKRKYCTDPLPTCENKCNRQLICGPDKNRHRCQKKCHVGPCSPCKQKSTVKCECSRSSRTVDCSLMFEKVIDEEDSNRVIGFKQVKYTFKCEMRCPMLKNCGRHKCQEKCCDAERNSSSRAHICNQLCNRKLPCGSHNCQETCHPSLCGDCPNIGWSELTCHCGASVMYPPIPCGARPPICHRPCQRTHSCYHPVKHECHDGTEKCAPCTEFTKKACFCGAESKNSVYCYLPGYSCGRTCKKQLSCRQHTCKRVCHDGDCETPNSRGVIVCSQPCPMPRFVCKHPCDLPCHGRTPCLASNCAKIIEILCECGNRTERIECFKLSKDLDNRNKVAMLSMNRPNQDSIVIDLTRKSTTITASGLTTNSVGQSNASANSTKKLDCDESCALYKRNKALAEALDIAQPNLESTIRGEDPLKLLRDATAHDYKFVAATYNSLAKFVKSAQESERRFIFLQFPPADKLKREVVHELAYHFNCSSESRDQEPERYVMVRASRNKSSVPDFTIEQLLPIDN